MKILFVSDIHGSPSGLRRALEFYDSEGAELLCLGGDIINYGPRNGVPSDLNPQAVVGLLAPHRHEIVAVRGNCDSEVDQMLLPFPTLSDYALVVNEGKRIVLTHGHLPFAQDMLKEADAEGKDMGIDKGKDNAKGGTGGWLTCDMMVMGHTHLWELQRMADGTLLCNMGSVTFPKMGREATFAYFDGRAMSIRTLEGKILKEMEL